MTLVVAVSDPDGDIVVLRLENPPAGIRLRMAGYRERRIILRRGNIPPRCRL
jgi:hypothetical protein